jgi:hypothetical protein
LSCIVRQHMGRQKIVDCVADIPWMQLAVNFIMHAVLICQWHSQIFEYFQNFQIFTCFMLWFCPEFCSWDIYHISCFIKTLFSEKCPQKMTLNISRLLNVQKYLANFSVSLRHVMWYSIFWIFTQSFKTYKALGHVLYVVKNIGSWERYAA